MMAASRSDLLGRTDIPKAAHGKRDIGRIDLSVEPIMWSPVFDLTLPPRNAIAAVCSSMRARPGGSALHSFRKEGIELGIRCCRTPIFTHVEPPGT